MPRPAPRWRTKTGETIPVTEMTTRHIQNCIHLINRTIKGMEHNVDCGYNLLDSMCSPDSMASYSIEADITRAETNLIEATHNGRYWIKVFEAELKRRSKPE